MAIQYSGGTNINTTFTGNTKITICNGVETALVSAGWSVISGTGTNDVKLQSATTPQGLAMRLRVRDAGGVCTVFNFLNPGETRTSGTWAWMLPATNKTWRVIANPYQAFLLVPGSTAAESFAAWGVPYIPPHLVGVITEAIWGHSNSQYDNNSGIWSSFRTSTHTNVRSGYYNPGAQSCLINGNLWDYYNSNDGTASYSGYQSLSGMCSTSLIGLPATQVWHDSSAMIIDPYISWGTGGRSESGLIRGQLWDAVVVMTSMTADTTFSLDAKTWFAVTGSNITNMQSSLCVVVP